MRAARPRRSVDSGIWGSKRICCGQACAILCQRLFRRLCHCAVWSDEETVKFGFAASRVRVPTGCEQCAGTGYKGRILLAELLRPDVKEVGRAILDRSDAADIQNLARKSGFVSIGERATTAVLEGRTSPIEARRVLGFRENGR